MNKIGYILRKKRLNAAFSQVEYAKQIGITDVTLSKIENGKHFGVRTTRKISKITGIKTAKVRQMMFDEIEVE